MLAKTDFSCYGPYVHVIEFASFQAEGQMDRLPSDKSDEVFASCSLSSFGFTQTSKSKKICPFLRLILGYV